MTRVIRLCDVLVEAGIIGLLLLTPLPFGSVHPWAQSLLEAMVGMLVVLVVIRALAAREVVIPRHPLLWPGLAMLLLLGLQLLHADGTVSPYATRRSAQLYVALLAYLVVLATHLVTRARIIRLVSVIVGWGVVLALVGLVNHAMGGQRILWLPKVYYLGRLTSTFINPNHQALYFSIPLFLAIGLLLQFPPQVKFGAAPPRPVASAWRIGAAGRVLLIGGILILGIALLLTASRGGVVGSLAGLAVLLVLTLHRRVSWRLPIALALAAVAFAGYANGFALDLLLERFRVVARDPIGDMRWPVWEATLQIVRERPVLGIGLGAFEDAFRVGQPPSISLRRLVDYAHNDYLQLLAETGALGALVLLWAMAAITVFVVGRWLGRKDLFVRSLVMGGLAALTSVAVHSATDFGLHMPANALLVVTLAVLLPAAVTLTLHRSGYRVDLGAWRIPLSSTPRVAMVAAMLAVCAVVALAPIAPALADWQLRRALAVTGEGRGEASVVLLRDLDEAMGHLSVAARLDPRNPAIQAALAKISDELARRVWIGGVTRDGRRLADTSPASRLEASQDLLATAYGAYQASLRERPRSAVTHEGFAWFLGRLETIRRTVRGGASATPLPPALAATFTSDESLVPRALNHFGEAIRWEPNNTDHHQSLARFALARIGEIPSARSLVTQEFRRTLTIYRWALPDVVEWLTAPSVDPSLLLLSIPEDSLLLADLGRELERRGRRQAATMAFEEALAVATEPDQQVPVRLIFAHVLKTRYDYAGALAQVRQALVLAPKDPAVFATLGQVYEAAQRFDDAEPALTTAARLAGEGSPRMGREYLADLASYLTRRGDLERALLLRRRLVGELPADAMAHLEVARLLEARREWLAASESYRMAGELGSGQPAIQLEVGRAYLRNGQTREAQASLEAALRLAPSPDVRLVLAEAYTRSGRRDQAIQQYRGVLAVDPGQETAARALVSLGGVLAEPAPAVRGARP